MKEAIHPKYHSVDVRCACGATWLLVDRDRFPHLAPDQPVAYRDARWVLYRL